MPARLPNLTAKRKGEGEGHEAELQAGRTPACASQRQSFPGCGLIQELLGLSGQWDGGHSPCPAALSRGGSWRARGSRQSVTATSLDIRALRAAGQPFTLAGMNRINISQGTPEINGLQSTLILRSGGQPEPESAWEFQS